jgi:hypothetical protein
MFVDSLWPFPGRIPQRFTGGFCRVPLVRFERTALNLGGSCSIRLSYRGNGRAMLAPAL